MSSTYPAIRAFVFLLFWALPYSSYAQRELSGSAQLQVALEKLNITGSVLMIAAHPDDENTALLAYFARGAKVRTAYLALTRGEGGQNLIGHEQSDALGVIRTEELLAARRIDGAEQFFTRAIDFGFTKTPKEAFDKWGRERILGDVVWVIRQFRPDVIILRFSGTPRDGHGQHQASAILAREAFAAAADPNRYPEQLKWAQPWQAKRLMWNVFSFNREQQREAEQLKDRLEVDPGEYDPVLGHSYGEIAGMSRSMHKSQGMGTFERRGAQKNYLVTIAGDKAVKSVFDGIDITWSGVPGGGLVSDLFSQALRDFDPSHPAKLVPILLKARQAMAEMHHPVAERKRRELDEAIALASGLWLDATANKFASLPGESFEVTRTVLNRGPLEIEFDGKSLPANEPVTVRDKAPIEASAPYSGPYWLAEPKSGESYTVRDQKLIGRPENPPLLESKFRVKIAGQEIEYTRPVVYRYSDHVLGELVRPLVVVPPVAVEMPEMALLFPDRKPRQVDVELRATTGAASGELRLEAPAGWKVEPQSRKFDLAGAGQECAPAFQVTPPDGETRGELRAAVTVNGRTITAGMHMIDYPHIPPQALFPPAQTDLVRADVQLVSKNIGYIMGAGDAEPQSLRQLGATVTLLTAPDLAKSDLSVYNAIVTGVRAYNTRPDLRANQQRLLDYVENGGTLIVQYITLEGGGPVATGSLPLDRLGPYPFSIGGERVTEEDAAVKFENASNVILHRPNEISAHDFEGWIQERGLNFASNWDNRYEPLFETHDAGEKPHLGGALMTRYGKGTYIFTAFSFFRQLPAGVPGAYRLFANFLSGRN